MVLKDILILNTIFKFNTKNKRYNTSGVDVQSLKKL